VGDPSPEGSAVGTSVGDILVNSLGYNVGLDTVGHRVGTSTTSEATVVDGVEYVGFLLFEGFTVGSKLFSSSSEVGLGSLSVEGFEVVSLPSVGDATVGTSPIGAFVGLAPEVGFDVVTSSVSTLVGLPCVGLNVGSDIVDSTSSSTVLVGLEGTGLLLEVGVEVDSDTSSSITAVGFAGVPFEVGETVGSSIKGALEGEGLTLEVGDSVGSLVSTSTTVVGFAGVPLEVGRLVGSTKDVVSSPSSTTTVVGVPGEDGILFSVGEEVGFDVLPIVGLLFDEGVGRKVGSTSVSLSTVGESDKEGLLAVDGFSVGIDATSTTVVGSDVLPIVGLV